MSTSLYRFNFTSSILQSCQATVVVSVAIRLPLNEMPVPNSRFFSVSGHLCVSEDVGRPCAMRSEILSFIPRQINLESPNWVIEINQKGHDPDLPMYASSKISFDFALRQRYRSLFTPGSKGSQGWDRDSMIWTYKKVGAYRRLTASDTPLNDWRLCWQPIWALRRQCSYLHSGDMERIF